MARIRTIKPTFFRSRAVRRLSSSDVKLLWVGLWPIADDEGRLIDEPTLLVGDLWALDLTAEQIESALAELHEAGRIIRYEANGEQYIQITNWTDHQRIQKPNHSEIPPAPLRDESGSATGTLPGGREGKGRGREGSAIATPFCEMHPKGTDKPCRACGDARRAYEALQTAEKSKPTLTPPRKADLCPEHEWNLAATCTEPHREAVAS